MRTKKAITIVVLVFVVGFIFATINNSVVLSDENYAYLSDYTWEKNLDKGLAISKEESKPVFVYFWAVWCQYCEKFETQTLTDPRIKQVLEEDFVMVAIDLDEDRAVAGRYGVSYPPHELFVDENGEVINRVGGYIDADSFYRILQQVRANYYSTHGGQ
ncbi:MAG: thioredoxin family protein [ANME-2 cluster archaeon]|nr:thioredoxin family protein [ANME-2 cluster archaeon]